MVGCFICWVKVHVCSVSLLLLTVACVKYRVVTCHYNAETSSYVIYFYVLLVFIWGHCHCNATASNGQAVFKFENEHLCVSLFCFIVLLTLIMDRVWEVSFHCGDWWVIDVCTFKTTGQTWVKQVSEVCFVAGLLPWSQAHWWSLG